MIEDKSFGLLDYDYSLFRGYQLNFLGENVTTELRIQADELNEITDNQREAFEHYCQSEESIIGDVESSIFNYYIENCEEFRESYPNQKDTVAPYIKEKYQLKELVTLLAVKVMYSSDNTRKIGFIFNAKFDPELGVGVLVKNEKVDEVTVQDIVLG